ncbi:hypothetical protein Glove_346g29 [Diversispora epigaea]|uniref:Uncharacterized protein n=1 Tax=Diversispora epigaea TaxID=1348612 RepID=A0A397HEW0_9GLOM|nr:hypothetical protein Glove_346g29 [Diversispora epigaea]
MGQSLSVVRELPRTITSSKKRSALLALIVILGYLAKKHVEEKKRQSRSIARNAASSQDNRSRQTKRQLNVPSRQVISTYKIFYHSLKFSLILYF